MTERQQPSRVLEPRVDAILMRRHPEHRFELPDEMKRRDRHLARDAFDRPVRLAHLAQEVACLAELTEPRLSHQHAP